jgi:glycosyltransferase involved in cell wall biosynthesis
MAKQKILQIGNYPPPMCGWAIQTVLLKRELERRGEICSVMNINENHSIKSAEYIDVQGGVDYVVKLFRYLLQGFRLNVHVNGGSPKGYILALIAALLGRLFFRPTIVTFHGGLPQTFFPRHDSKFYFWKYRLLFRIAGSLTCDSAEIKAAIEAYGVNAFKIAAIPCFSSELLDVKPVVLEAETERFLTSHFPVFFCYVSFRPEYRLEMLREAMRIFRSSYSNAGFIWLGFPEKEMPAVREFIANWPREESESLLLLANLTHDQFVTSLARCYGKIRTPACDGISASVLESLALGVPVIASENGRRPEGVVTYNELDASDLAQKLRFVMDNYASVKAHTRLLDQSRTNNTELMADWVLGSDEPASAAKTVQAS